MSQPWGKYSPTPLITPLFMLCYLFFIFFRRFVIYVVAKGEESIKCFFFKKKNNLKYVGGNCGESKGLDRED